MNNYLLTIFLLECTESLQLKLILYKKQFLPQFPFNEDQLDIDHFDGFNHGNSFLYYIIVRNVEGYLNT